MRKIYGIGETVFDIIFKDGSPQAAKAGGSVLNSVVSMGRVGLPVSFISEFGKDDVGNLIETFLKDNGVNTSFINRYEDSNTTLALAFLDEKNDARYTFYKNHHPGKLKSDHPDVRKDDILLCGSFYSIWSEIRERFKRLVSGAREKGALVIYDPNFRKSHLIELENLRPLIIENMQMANLVRGSNEDFKNIFGAGNVDDAYMEIKHYCTNLVYTANNEGVYVKTPGFSGKFDVKKITPVSTIGAGDNFNAGMITSIFQKNIRPDQLSSLTEKEWEEIIATAIDFATEVCLSYENYISGDFAEKFKTSSL
ncbi:MAG: PfkB family carbohydrate kinase [Bacteroidales bacterium]|jgi:fructokinase|nr:PfkB family carbohydrate kinase [Bacteroidales bacterium]